MIDPEILALGEPLVEMVRLPPCPDGRVLYQQRIGGDTLTTLVTAARRGASTGYLTAVGDNPLGEEIIAFCENEGVSTEFILRRHGEPTGVNIIDPDPTERRFTYARRGSAASQYGPEDLPHEAIAAAKVLHITGVSMAISEQMRNACWTAAKIARGNGTLVSFDFNLRINLWPLEQARAEILRFLPMVDILFPTEDEATLIFR